MRIVAIATVKNEADIIEAFVRHTLAVVQHLVVLDNGSCDGTHVILNALRREGLALDIVEDASPGQRQAERMTILMREYAVGRHAAAWVLPLDADEFVVAQDGALTAMADDSAPVALSWRTYVPQGDDPIAELNPVLRITHRLREENWPWSKMLVPGKLAALPGARLTQGSHQFCIGDKDCAPATFPKACLAHFPIRSPGQYLAKVAVAHLQYLVMPNKPADWGWLYRLPFEQLKNDAAGLAANYSPAAARYAVPANTPAQTATVRDPLQYRGTLLRYTRQREDCWHPLQVVASHAEKLAGLAATAASEKGGFQQQLEQIQRQRADLEGEILRLRQQLAAEKHRGNAFEHACAAMWRSWTWRSGRLLVGPAAWLKRTAKRLRQSHQQRELDHRS